MVPKNPQIFVVKTSPKTVLADYQKLMQMANYQNYFDKETRKTPILLSTNLHITQGCCEIKKFEYKVDQNKLNIELELIGVREGSLILKLPKNKKIIKYNFGFSMIDPINNIWNLYVRFKDKISLEVDIA